MLNINNHSEIYIICPANIATGGPELLHQMAFKLNTINVKAFMFYINRKEENPVHHFYKHYNVPFKDEVNNNPKNLVIIPEVLIDSIYDKRFSDMQKVIWWLSVDNYSDFINSLINRHQHKKTFKIKQLFNYYKIPTIERIRSKSKFHHLVQSYYAKDFLINHHINNVDYLSDYLSASFFENASLLEDNLRSDIVLYNPKKGIEFTKEIINGAKHITFTPIENLNPNQVAELLSKSKVYIDFGNHPGKDRFPREAAIMGCCVITNKKGSANFQEDVPIAEEFKFTEESGNISKIIKKIEDCLRNFNQQNIKFEKYKEWIKADEIRFNHDISKIFSPNAPKV